MSRVDVDVDGTALAGYRPTPAQLAAVQVPCVVAAGSEDRDLGTRHGRCAAVAGVLADGLDVDLVELPGSHVPQASHPRERAEAVRGLARRLHARPPRS